MMCNAFIDGASRGNPGESGIGVLIKDLNGEVIESISGYIGLTTNNIAEYTALLVCLNKVVELKCKKIVVYTDSELLTRQLKGIYKVKNQGIKKIYAKVQNLIKASEFDFEIHHIAREKNSDADFLANVGIDNKKRIKLINT